MKPVTYFFNGRICTLDPRDTVASSLLAREGKIAALDPGKDALAAADPGLERVDLGGAVVFPGFIDTHVHVASLGRLSQSFADLYRVRSVEEIVDRLKEKAAVRAEGPVTGFGPNLQPELLKEKRLPSAADLDRVAADRPVMTHDVNKYIVNSFILDRVPAEDLVKARALWKGGEENVFYGKARGLVPAECQEPPSRDARLDDEILRGLDLCAAAGLTAVVNASVTLEQARALRRLNREGRVPLKVILLIFQASPAELAAEGISPGLVEGRLTFGPLKYFWDMFVMHKSALMREAYLGEPDNRGASFVSPAEFRKTLSAAFDAGWPVGVHCTGDRALDELTDMLEAEKERMAGLPPSHIIHAYFPSASAMEICRDLKVGFAVQPGFIRDWGDTLPLLIGDRRASRFLPLRTMLANDLKVGGGSDAPIIRMCPVADMAVAISRQTACGRCLDVSECLRAEDVLRIYTTGAAALAGKEKELGSLEAGKSADFTVLDRDIRSLPAPDIAEAMVLMTVVEGRAVYRAHK
jgi:hypothetical protein